MRAIFVLLFFIGSYSFAQNESLAKEYFLNAEFEKSLNEYKKLYTKSPSNLNYIAQIVENYQQLEKYDEAEFFLLDLIKRSSYPSFFVELGYNYQLKNDDENAKLYYNKAIESLDLRPSFVFAITRVFENHSLLSETIQAYKKAIELNPEFDFDLQLAQLYGEQGDIEKMFASYIDFAENNPYALSNVKLYISNFVSENSLNENNILLRRILLKKNQQEPNLLWNDLLSWLFIQQKDFNKAFIQEKAIFNRNRESSAKIESLAKIALDENDTETAKSIYSFIIESVQDLDALLNAHYNLLQINIKGSSQENYSTIALEYLELFETFGTFSQTLNLQISYAHFLAFYMDEPSQASSFLEDTLKLPLTEFEKAKVKLELGDILVLQEKFNEALIYFTQIQRNIKNSNVSQEARYKVAKASYFKGDFKWAESQLKILKASTSQLIANDALALKLLISDNKDEDSLQTALKLYAKADLLAFQNKNPEAISAIDEILENHKTEPIVAQALFKQAELYEAKKDYVKAAINYQSIVTNYPDGILIDDALYKLGDIYERHMADLEKAKYLYEQILFNHSDSIYFVEARKRYRALRGDAINL